MCPAITRPALSVDMLLFFAERCSCRDPRSPAKKEALGLALAVVVDRALRQARDPIVRNLTPGDFYSESITILAVHQGSGIAVDQAR